MRMFNRGSARLAAAAGALMLAGLGLGAPGIAHPHEEDSAERKVEKVIILREGEDGKDGAKGDRVRRFRIEGEGEHSGKRIRTIRIEGDGDGKGEHVRTFHIERHGEDGKAGGRHVRAFRIDGANMIDCDGEKTEIDEATGGERERTRTRVVICGKGDLNAAQRIEKLEKALSRINANQEISVEHKEKVTAALREAMERLRATP